MPSRTIRFVKKPYGIPKAHTGQKMPNPESKVMLESEVLQARKDWLNNQIILYNKFMNLKTKRALITSEFQKLKPPPKRYE